MIFFYFECLWTNQSWTNPHCSEYDSDIIRNFSLLFEINLNAEENDSIFLKQCYYTYNIYFEEINYQVWSFHVKIFKYIFLRIIYNIIALNIVIL